VIIPATQPMLSAAGLAEVCGMASGFRGLKSALLNAIALLAFGLGMTGWLNPYAGVVVMSFAVVYFVWELHNVPFVIDLLDRAERITSSIVLIGIVVVVCAPGIYRKLTEVPIPVSTPTFVTVPYQPASSGHKTPTIDPKLPIPTPNVVPVSSAPSIVTKPSTSQKDLLENRQLIQQAANLEQQFNSALDIHVSKLNDAKQKVENKTAGSPVYKYGLDLQVNAEIEAANESYEEKISMLAAQAESLQRQIQIRLGRPIDNDFVTWHDAFVAAHQSQNTNLNPRAAGEYLRKYVRTLPH
jgi:hypothetical protein